MSTFVNSILHCIYSYVQEDLWSYLSYLSLLQFCCPILKEFLVGNNILIIIIKVSEPPKFVVMLVPVQGTNISNDKHKNSYENISNKRLITKKIQKISLLKKVSPKAGYDAAFQSWAQRDNCFDQSDIVFRFKHCHLSYYLYEGKTFLTCHRSLTVVALSLGLTLKKLWQAQLCFFKCYTTSHQLPPWTKKIQDRQKQGRIYTNKPFLIVVEQQEYLTCLFTQARV